MNSLVNVWSRSAGKRANGRRSVSREIPQCISLPTQIAAVSATLLSVKISHLAHFTVGVIFLLNWLIGGAGCHGYIKTCRAEQYV